MNIKIPSVETLELAQRVNFLRGVANNHANYPGVVVQAAAEYEEKLPALIAGYEKDGFSLKELPPWLRKAARATKKVG